MVSLDRTSRIAPGSGREVLQRKWRIRFGPIESRLYWLDTMQVKRYRDPSVIEQSTKKPKSGGDGL
ncbi:MAG: hypothetical protein DHS20C16_03240 [Phycisphaerae bacterium]|nr:MAG: hypothetical protein DHS20C16_03240 [Phycisphaerae bacterium]